ncbi:MAG: hypothetical protein SPG03_05415 [Veillonella caviae]|uniref:hypothetical protein n=1 Tax=Veillonella caviae TaxID=248316 RepID=UPI002A90D864|nr:hypothetical protein [Veillonella caviae]MDY5481810.1 hypothetical protein [Veillonella caviae]
MTHFGVSGANVKGHIDSDYKSVTQQAGIHAGAKGIDITVGDTTTLKGAIITSTAPPGNNKLSTKQLITEVIQNEASYKAKQSGVSMNTSGLTGKGILGKINPLGLSPVVIIPVSDSASSTTRSAISENIILDVENKSAADINRDTEHALNSIKPIFDKDDVKERLAYVNAVSAEGFKLIGDISMAQAKRYEEKAANANTDTLRERYLKEADKWKDGGIYKVALHGGLGVAIANMAGGSSLQGFTIASANELMVGAISKELAKHPHSTIDEQGRYIDNSDVYKLASAVLGGAITNSSLGAGIAVSATEHNYLTHEQKLQLDKEFNEAKTKSEKLAVLSKWSAIDQEQERILKNQIEGLYFSKLADEYNPNLYIPVAYDIKRAKEDNNWQEIDYKSYDKIIDSMHGGAEYYLDDIIVVGTRIDNGESLLEKLEATRVKGLNNLARLDAVLAGYQPGTEEFDLAVLHNFNEANHKYYSELYKYKSAGYGLTDAVADNMTFDGAATAREAMDIEHPNNDYYYGGRIVGDVITTVGGAGTAASGAVETVGAAAGGVTAVATPATSAQTVAGAAVAVKSGKSLGEDIARFTQTKAKSSSILQEYQEDISPIKDRVSKEQYRKMELNEPLKNHKVYGRTERRSLDEISEPNSSQDLMVDGKLKQRRYFGNNGEKIVDIDFFHQGKWPFPHKHIWIDGERSGHNYVSIR